MDKFMKNVMKWTVLKFLYSVKQYSQKSLRWGDGVAAEVVACPLHTGLSTLDDTNPTDSSIVEISLVVF